MFLFKMFFLANNVRKPWVLYFFPPGVGSDCDSVGFLLSFSYFSSLLLPTPPYLFLILPLLIRGKRISKANSYIIFLKRGVCRK